MSRFLVKIQLKVTRCLWPMKKEGREFSYLTVVPGMLLVLTVHIITLFHSLLTTVLAEVARSELLCKSLLQRSLDSTLKQYANLLRLAAYRKTFTFKLLKLLNSKFQCAPYICNAVCSTM